MARLLGRILVLQQPDAANAGQFLNVCGFLARTLSMTNNMIEEAQIPCDTPESPTERTRAFGTQDRVFSGSGIFENEARGILLADAAENQTVLSGYRVFLPGYGNWTGDWAVTDYSFEGSEEGSLRFSATVSQYENVTFTAIV